MWLNGRVVRTLDLRSRGCGFESWPPDVECNPGQVVNRHVPLSPNSIIWYEPMAGKVTVCLASHWPLVTDICNSPPMGSRSRRRWTPAYTLLVECGKLFLTLHAGFHWVMKDLNHWAVAGPLLCWDFDVESVDNDTFQKVMTVSAPRHYARWLRRRVPDIATKLPSLKQAKGEELTSRLLREADNNSVTSLLLEVCFV